MSDILSPEYTSTLESFAPGWFLDLCEGAGLLDPYLEDPNHNQRTILAAVVASLNEKRKTSSFGDRQMWLVFPSIAYVDGKMVNHGPGQVRLVPQEFHFSVTNLSRTVASLTKLRDETEKVLIAMYAGHRGGVS